MAKPNIITDLMSAIRNRHSYTTAKNTRLSSIKKLAEDIKLTSNMLNNIYKISGQENLDSPPLLAIAKLNGNEDIGYQISRESLAKEDTEALKNFDENYEINKLIELMKGDLAVRLAVLEDYRARQKKVELKPNSTIFQYILSKYSESVAIDSFSQDQSIREKALKNLENLKKYIPTSEYLNRDNKQHLKKNEDFKFRQKALLQGLDRAYAYGFKNHQDDSSFNTFKKNFFSHRIGLIPQTNLAFTSDVKNKEFFIKSLDQQPKPVKHVLAIGTSDYHMLIKGISNNLKENQNIEENFNNPDFVDYTPDNAKIVAQVGRFTTYFDEETERYYHQFLLMNRQAPNMSEDEIAYYKSIVEDCNDSDSLLVAHCKGGTGRTGVFIKAALSLFDINYNIDSNKTVFENIVEWINGKRNQIAGGSFEEGRGALNSTYNDQKADAGRTYNLLKETTNKKFKDYTSHSNSEIEKLLNELKNLKKEIPNSLKKIDNKKLKNDFFNNLSSYEKLAIYKYFSYVNITEELNDIIDNRDINKSDYGEKLKVLISLLNEIKNLQQLPKEFDFEKNIVEKFVERRRNIFSERNKDVCKIESELILKNLKNLKNIEFKEKDLAGYNKLINNYIEIIEYIKNNESLFDESELSYFKNLNSLIIEKIKLLNNKVNSLENSKDFNDLDKSKAEINDYFIKINEILNNDNPIKSLNLSTNVSVNNETQLEIEKNEVIESVEEIKPVIPVEENSQHNIVEGNDRFQIDEDNQTEQNLGEKPSTILMNTSDSHNSTGNVPNTANLSTNSTPEKKIYNEAEQLLSRLKNNENGFNGENLKECVDFFIEVKKYIENLDERDEKSFLSSKEGNNLTYILSNIFEHAYHNKNELLSIDELRRNAVSINRLSLGVQDSKSIKTDFSQKKRSFSAITYTYDQIIPTVENASSDKNTNSKNFSDDSSIKSKSSRKSLPAKVFSDVSKKIKNKK